MIWRIKYERQNEQKTCGVVTFISKTNDPLTAIERFEAQHLNYLKVTNCRPKYAAKARRVAKQEAQDRQAIRCRQNRKTYQLSISVDGESETHTSNTLSDAADQVKFYADNCTILPDSICITKTI